MLSNAITPSSSWPKEESLCKSEHRLSTGYFKNLKSGHSGKKSSSKKILLDSHSPHEARPSYLRSLIERQSFRKRKNKDYRLSIQIDDDKLKVEVEKASKYFYAAVKAFGIVSSKDIYKHMNMMIEEIWKERNESLDYLSIKIQKCYKKMKIWLEDMDEEVIDENIGAFLDCIERYLMTIFHSHVYDRICKGNVTDDTAISRKICSLKWLTSTHLGTNINEADKNIMSLVDKAVIDMISVDLKKNSLCKLKCILECSKKIFTILKLHNSKGSADEFLPVMVYIVLKANPPRLCSNIRYIQKFSFGERITKGEEGYYFTHLCSALSYIENITPEFLNLSEEEFRNHFIEDTTCPKKEVTERLLHIFTNAAEMAVISQSQENLMDRTCTLKNEMKKLKESISEDNLRMNAVREEWIIKRVPCVLNSDLLPTFQDFTDPTNNCTTDFTIIDKDSCLKSLGQKVYFSAEPPVVKGQDCSYLRSNILNDCCIEKAVDALEFLELGDKQQDTSFSI